MTPWPQTLGATVNWKLCIERLETRDCPATVNLFNGILTVTGTNGNDVITITQTGNTIQVGGQGFNAALVNRVVVTAQGGDDVVDDQSRKPTVIYGGFGNDFLYGRGGTDRIYGGAGNDRLVGGGGDDILYGGRGTDTLVDNSGVNTLREGSPNRSRSNSAIEQQIINLVNQERAAAGLPPLTVNLQLNGAAQFHTQDMVTISNQYGPATAHQHTLYGTIRPELTDRLDAAGYDDWTTSFTFGENIAYGYTSAAEVMAGWMNSPGHRANILSTTFTEIGVSVIADNSGTLFFTQNFGRRV